MRGRKGKREKVKDSRAAIVLCTVYPVLTAVGLRKTQHIHKYGCDEFSFGVELSCI